MFSDLQDMMSEKPFPPAPIAAILSFSFGDSLPGTTLASLAAMRTLVDAQAEWDAASVVVVAIKARRVMSLCFMMNLLNPNGEDKWPRLR
jgi:hypothetical protein